MLFSSIIFIYYFLPIFLLFYFIAPNKYKNIIILLFSLIFYFLGEPKYIMVLLISCVLNYIFSKLIQKQKHPKLYLWLAIIYNIGQLLFFKYTDFFISNINNIFSFNISFMYIIMPIGISFFTFQALGYIIDVYTKKHEPARNLLDFMTYVCMFPQLIAGPIVRYKDVEKSLVRRNITYSTFSEGIKRFAVGLSKKVLLANVLGQLSSSFILTTVLASWLKPITYTLQIYFDFSGYSDMAIGLGLMMGFRFPENFKYPLIASTITDFWRRWHISLSSWFKDYVYIPLGGNRVSKIKWVRNIFIVWFLTGFWHGASWNFILWGLYFGIILIIEKLFLKKYLDKTNFIKYLYTFVIVVMSFLIFNTTSLPDISISLKNMFFMSDIPFTSQETMYYLKSNLVLLIISFVAATPFMHNVVEQLNKTKLSIVIHIFEPIFYIILIALSTAFLIDESFNPFLYFRF